MPIGLTTAVVGAGVLGAGASIYAANTAASAQKKAAQQATTVEQNAINQTQANEQPFINAGQSALGQLQTLTGTNPGGNPLTAPLTAPFQPTQAQLEATPGYQFTLGQGLKSTQNSYAAQGLANSGSALKGAAQFATGLADTTYQQQFGNYLTQNAQIANILQNQVNTGAGAAGTTGQLTNQAAANIGSNAIGAGNAQAAASIASGNAVGQAPVNSLLTYALANNSGIFGQNSGATASGTGVGSGLGINGYGSYNPFIVSPYQSSEPLEA